MAAAKKTPEPQFLPEPHQLDLLALIAHELKSPLATILTTVDTLQQGYFGAVNEAQRNALAAVLRNCHYLEDNLRCYLALAELERDGREFLPQQLCLLRDVISPVLNIPEYRDNAKKMPLCLDAAAEVAVQGETGLLQSALGNLLNNALKYGEAGTPVTVKVGRENGQVLIRVCNSGKTIAEDLQARLFQPFSRLRLPGSEGIKGSGLGLYLCRRIAELHGGSVGFANIGNDAVEFSLVLPTAASGD